MASAWPPGFICTSSSALLANTQRQCCTGHVSPGGTGDSELLKSHDVYTQKTHGPVVAWEAPLTGELRAVASASQAEDGQLLLTLL